MIQYEKIKGDLLEGLYNYTAQKIMMANQSRKPEKPYMTLKFTSLLANDSMNPNEYTSEVDEGVEVREVTNPEIVASITCYGETDDQAVESALQAYSWFKTAGYYELQEKDIIVLSTQPIQNRDVLLGEVAYERRQGFDVRMRVEGEIRYTVDSIETIEIQNELDAESP